MAQVIPWDKNWPSWLLMVSSRWPKWSQPAVTEPWPGPWLSCGLAVTEPWSYWRCRDWAVTELWLRCDLAMTEMWPRRDLAVTSPSRDWAVITGPRSRDHHGHREPTVSSRWAHGDHLFSHGMACCLMAPSHYLNQCCLIISKVQWHSSEGNFTSDSSVTVCLINKLTAGFHCSTVSHKIIFAYIELPNLQLWDANNVHDDVIKWKHFPRH